MNAFGFTNISDKTGTGFERKEIIEEPLHAGDLRLCPSWLRITDHEVKSYNNNTKNYEKDLDQLTLF